MSIVRYKTKLKYRIGRIAAVLPVAACVILSTVFACSSSVSAQVPFQSYNYNVWGESVPVPATYTVDRILDGKSLGIPSFKNPGDLFIDGQGQVFVLDSGNNRIVVLNKELQFLKEIRIRQPGESGTNGESGKAASGQNAASPDLSTASGIYVTPENTIWIAMGAAGGLLETDKDGVILNSIEKPTGKNAPADLVFKPLKIGIGADGTLYTVSEGVFEGIVELNQDGTFLGYFGSNKVDVTLKVITEMFWKKFFSIFSDTAAESMIKIVPIEYSAIDMNEKGFIYAVTSDSSNSMNEVKKLDPKGNNIIRVKSSADVSPGVLLNIGNYGDIETSYDQGSKVDTKFMDVCVDRDGFIFSLDAQRGRIFEYDQESNLVAIFGGLGSQRGTFDTPVAIECAGDRVFVLDKKTGEITLFKPTGFGSAVRNATLKFNEGLYEEAESQWQSVLLQSANYELAYTGIGKALFNRMEYTGAMKYFKLGYDKKGYDEAYTEYRKDLLRKNLAWVGIAILLLAAAAVVIARFRKKRAVPAPEGNKKILPVSFVLFHPFKASDEVRTENRGSLVYSVGIVLVLALTRVLKIGLSGFLFNNTRLENISVVREAGMVIGLYVIWIVANWAVCTLMEGEGRVRDIAIITAHSLIPLIISDLAIIVLSNVLTIREGAFLSFLAGLSLYWTGMLLFIGVMIIHRYSAGKAVASMVLTIAGILFILFLGALVYSLFSQMIIFFGNIFTEIMYRI